MLIFYYSDQRRQGKEWKPESLGFFGQAEYNGGLRNPWSLDTDFLVYQ